MAALQIARLVVILALLGLAAAIATPKGRLPLALRGLAKLLGRREVAPPQPSPVKRLIALSLVLLAIFLALV